MEQFMEDFIEDRDIMDILANQHTEPELAPHYGELDLEEEGRGSVHTSRG